MLALQLALITIYFRQLRVGDAVEGFPVNSVCRLVAGSPFK